MYSLEKLHLGYNQFTSLPDIFGDLASLYFFSAPGNKLTKFPSSLLYLPLTDLILSDNPQLGDESLEDVFAMTTLERLYLANVGLTKVPETVETLENLFRFVFGRGMEGKKKKLILFLYRLDISFNSGLTELPEGVGAIQSLERLACSNCSIKILDPGSLIFFLIFIFIFFFFSF